MPVPSAITDLSSVASSNSPAGTEAPLPQLDDYLRALSSFIRQTYDSLATKAPIANAIPSGGIIAWSGTIAAIPSGWLICDGTSGTPDLRNRFLLGAGSTYAVGASGGATSAATDTQGAHTHTGNTGSTALTIAQLPAHDHTFTVTALNNDGGGSGSLTGGTTGGPDGSFSGTTGSTGSGSGHTHTISSDGGHTHTVATLPPYYALAYIMKS